MVLPKGAHAIARGEGFAGTNFIGVPTCARFDMLVSTRSTSDPFSHKTTYHLSPIT